MNFSQTRPRALSHPIAVAAKKKRAPARPSPKNVVAAARTGRTSRPSPSWRSIWESAKSLLGAVLIFLVIRTFLIEAYRIPSGSMIPTLLIGDWLFVNKMVYGPHIPFTDINLPGYGEPRRGDVVVFKSPPQFDQPWDLTPTLVKRLVGLAGDTLYMRNDLLYVNGMEQRQTPAAAARATGDPGYYHPSFEWQRAYELRTSRFPAPLARPTLGNWGPIIVPAGHYFMLGDSRHESKDGRYWGLVPRKNFRARPLFVYYSFRGGDEKRRPLPGLTDIRWSRIGTRIK
jgi:signal peptidase I